MKKIILFLVILLVGMEGVGWWAYENSKKISVPTAEVSIASPSNIAVQKTPKQEQANVGGASNPKAVSDVPINGGDLSSFPPPTVEVIGGIAQRTIHMGVRQWAWDPAQLSVKYGEKVILIMHNADVPHSISIPDLNVKSAIPAEGAIVTFTASKKGTFDFFCDTPCGKGHSQMRAKITIS